MNKFWLLIYNIFILPSLYLLLRIAGIFSGKIRTGISGRKRLFEDLVLNNRGLDKTKKVIWIHSSSLGEFEQAKPIIEKLWQQKKFNIIVTFFSPSGYENSKNYPYANLITYIPFDTKSNAERFIKIVQPDLSVLMRYDIWPNFIAELKKFEIPCYIVDATMRKNSSRAIPVIKSFHKGLFADITRILTVSKSDAKAFKIFKVKDEQLRIVGDTRFDRVYQKSLSAKEKKLINPKVFEGKKVFVAGSTWEQDEDVILPAFLKLAKFDNEVLMIIVPHEPTVLHLEKLENEFAGKIPSIRFSHLNNYSDERVIIVDSIGILLTLYTYADVAFVGGSFKQNVHNVLEAAVYGVPVMFGPKINNSQEAKQLAERGGGLLIRGKREAYRRLRTLFSDEQLRNTRGKIALEYIKENIGATDKIIEEIENII
ncbi:3-deoxy-D-manno-octulosonic acid transferase [bacterium BMS3Abin03]|nr:3-deoxy-D-manno-octulosonic acid transferase [bacterium BMS3Abin03]